MKNKLEFKKELEGLINKYSMENDSNTPDFILADYLVKCLEAFNLTTKWRTNWYSEDEKPKVYVTQGETIS
jgi:hypothetical protein